jgi:hypothetical protein
MPRSLICFATPTYRQRCRPARNGHWSS